MKRYSEFFVLGIDFKNPKRFFELIGCTPRGPAAMIPYGGVDNWTKKHFSGLSEKELIAKLESLNVTGSTENKQRALELVRIALEEVRDQDAFNEYDPARKMIVDILEYNDLNAGLKAFTKIK